MRLQYRDEGPIPSDSHGRLGREQWLHRRPLAAEHHNLHLRASDFNADGRSDIYRWFHCTVICENGTNAEDGLEAFIGVWPASTPTQVYNDLSTNGDPMAYPPAQIQLNADGRPDFLRKDGSYNIKTYVSRPGAAFIQKTANSALNAGSYDFNGDGKTELFTFTTTPRGFAFKLYTPPGSAGATLQTINNGYGGMTTFTYGPRPNGKLESSAYQADRCEHRHVRRSREHLNDHLRVRGRAVRPRQGPFPWVPLRQSHFAPKQQ